MDVDSKRKMKATTRKNARALGETSYFTGKPCKHGHIAERLTGTGACKVCKNHRDKAYREANKDRAKTYLAAYYANNLEREKRKRADYYVKNKDTIRKRVAAYASSNRNKIANRSVVYYESNKEKLLEKAKEYRENNAEKIRAYFRARQKAERSKINAVVKRIKLSKKKRVPSWLTRDDLWLIEEIYALAALRTQLTGVDWQVDHIIPLHGKTVSGLHVPTNLRVITKKENLSKSNKWTFQHGTAS